MQSRAGKAKWTDLENNCHIGELRSYWMVAFPAGVMVLPVNCCSVPHMAPVTVI